MNLWLLPLRHWERWFASPTKITTIQKTDYLWISTASSIRSYSERRYSPIFCFDVGVKTTKWPSSWRCEDEYEAYSTIVEKWRPFNPLKTQSSLQKFASLIPRARLDSPVFAFWRICFRVEKFKIHCDNFHLREVQDKYKIEIIKICFNLSAKFVMFTKKLIIKYTFCKSFVQNVYFGNPCYLPMQ